MVLLIIIPMTPMKNGYNYLGILTQHFQTNPGGEFRMEEWNFPKVEVLQLNFLCDWNAEVAAW